MENFEKQVKELINKYKDELLKDLARLVAIPSVSHSEQRKPFAPFGEEVAKVFDVYNDICERLGFETLNCDGYTIQAQTGNSDEYIAAIGHLDVVDAGNLSLWNHNPYEMKIDGDILYGRGVNDDKGPLLASLYALKIINDLNVKLKYDVRIIAGGAEETTWECMNYYFKKNPQPIMGFSPDGNFPIVNGEKGIFQFHYNFLKEKNSDNNIIKNIVCEKEANYVCDHVCIEIINCSFKEIQNIAQLADSITLNENNVVIVYKGTAALSRNPQRGVNALWKFAKDFSDFSFAQKGMNDLIKLLNKYFVDDYYGQKSSVYMEDNHMGKTSICPMSIIEKEDGYDLMMDYRYVNGIDKNEIEDRLKEKGKQYNAIMKVDKEKRMLYVKEDSKLIQSLKHAYSAVMNEEAEVFTKGGASYARVMDNGVAFGATFDGEDPQCHMPNERMSISSLLKACEIYVYAFISMASK